MKFIDRIKELAGLARKEPPRHYTIDDFWDAIAEMSVEKVGDDDVETEPIEQDRWSYKSDSHYTVTVGYYDTVYGKAEFRGSLPIDADVLSELGIEGGLSDETAKQAVLKGIDDEGFDIKSHLTENDIITGEDVDEVETTPKLTHIKRVGEDERGTPVYQFAVEVEYSYTRNHESDYDPY